MSDDESDTKKSFSDDEHDEKDEKHAKEDGEEEEEGEYVDTASSKLKELFLSETLADVHFIIGKERIPAHRLVLGLNSDVFRALLFPLTFATNSTGKTEGIYNPSGDIKDIEITDIKSPAVFKKMLEFFYDDNAEVTMDEVPEQLELARRFQLDSLRVACVALLEEDVSPETACRRMIDGRKLFNEPGFGLGFIEENTDDVIKTAGFLDLPLDCLITILASNKLNVDEIDLFNAVSKWAAAECKRQKLEVSGPNKKKVLGGAVQLIRFPLMDMQDIVSKVQSSGLLAPEDLLPLFTYIGAPESKKPKNVPWSTRPRGSGGTGKYTWSSEYQQITFSADKKTITSQGGPAWCRIEQPLTKPLRFKVNAQTNGWSPIALKSGPNMGFAEAGTTPQNLTFQFFNPYDGIFLDGKGFRQNLVPAQTGVTSSDWVLSYSAGKVKWILNGRELRVVPHKGPLYVYISPYHTGGTATIETGKK